MVVFDLTPAMMEAGAQLLALLQKAKHRVVACGWVYTEEEGRWQLIIAFPDRRLRSSWDAYEAI